MYKNQKGLTLIELLSTLTILSIVSSLVFGVLIGVNKNYKLISNDNNLKQQANISLATIKNVHQKYPSYFLSCDYLKKQCFIGELSATAPLVDSEIKVELELIDSVNKPIIGPLKIETAEPLYIKIKLQNKNGKIYSLDTIINKY